MSVAIRTAVRIQDQDDAPTLGAGQDGYAMVWDNTAKAFVATPLFTGGPLAMLCVFSRFPRRVRGCIWTWYEIAARSSFTAGPKSGTTASKTCQRQ